MANRQTNLRLDPGIKSAAMAAADLEGIPLARFVEQALAAYLGIDTNAGAAGDSEITAAIADLQSRLEAIEARLAPASVSPASAALSLKAATLAAGWQGNPENLKRDFALRGTTPQQWLLDRGWRPTGHRRPKWLPPLESPP